jgi:predicted nucleic acid-binding Zn ribbon protein
VLNPLPIADAEDVDVRRRAVGLGPLAEDIEQIRAEAQSYGERAPADRAARKAAMEAWARSVGWRD